MRASSDTRRCSRRQFLLRAGKRTNQAVMYCLAEAAQRFGIQVLWIFTMSGHLHYGLYDPDGSYPRFLAHFHKMVAKLLNCHWGRWANLFEAEQTSVVELADAGAVFDKMIYSLANGVRAQLVKHAADWPGATSLAFQLADEEMWAGLFGRQQEVSLGHVAKFHRCDLRVHREVLDAVDVSAKRKAIALSHRQHRIVRQ